MSNHSGSKVKFAIWTRTGDQAHDLLQSWRLLLPLIAISLMSACRPSIPLPNLPTSDVAPLITLQPASQSVMEPAAATFTTAATGTPTPTLQWQRSADGVTFSNIAGATSATYSTAATAVTNSGDRYRVVATNRASSATSNVAVLTVTAAETFPSITLQPVDQSVAAPMAASFNVSAAGTPTPTYQWQLSTDNVAYVDIAGATTNAYSTGATSAVQSGHRYRVVVTNNAGSVISNAAVLTVNAATAWSTPAIIGGENASQPAIAAAPDGYALITWVQRDVTDQQYNAYARIFDASANAWGSDRLIENLTTNPQATGYTSMGAYEPRVSLGENGRAAVVFGYSLPPSGYSARLVRHTRSPVVGAPGLETWSDVETLNATSENANSHAVSYFSTATDEYFMSSYAQYDSDAGVSGGPKSRVFGHAYHIPCKGASVCTSSPQLQSPAMIERSPGDSGHVELARLGNDGIAVWTQQWPASFAIWTSRFSGSTATWSIPQQLNLGSLSDAYPPVVAGNSAGAAIAAWLETGVGQHRVFASRLSNSGWSAPVRIDTAISPATAINLDSDTPAVSVAIDADGNTVVVWAQKENFIGAGSIYARRCAASAELSACAAAVELETAVEPAILPSAASAPNGDFWVVWEQLFGVSGNSVYANQYSNSLSQWGTPVLLGGVDLGGNNKPEIAIDGQGRVTVVWVDANDRRLYFTRKE